VGFDVYIYIVCVLDLLDELTHTAGTIERGTGMKRRETTRDEIVIMFDILFSFDGDFAAVVM